MVYIYVYFGMTFSRPLGGFEKNLLGGFEGGPQLPTESEAWLSQRQAVGLLGGDRGSLKESCVLGHQSHEILIEIVGLCWFTETLGNWRLMMFVFSMSSSTSMYALIRYWLVVWNMNFIFHFIYGIINPSHWHIFSKMVIAPPTRYYYYITIINHH